jgi:DNA-binding NarL/FixJ family response regulator
MDRVDSSYGRLASAWSQGLPGRTDVLAGASRSAIQGLSGATSNWANGSGSLAEVQQPINTASVPWVLVARPIARAPAVFDCGLLSSTEDSDRIYRVDSVVVESLDHLVLRCGAQTPRVLVVDGGLLASAQAAELSHFRRRLVAAKILLAWDRQPPNAFDQAVRIRARGSISWTPSAGNLSRALDALLAGEIWFPRHVFQSIYKQLLDADRAVEPTHAPVAADAPESSAASAPPLTQREAEILALMRYGLTNKQMAERLDISINTVKTHLAHVFEKRRLKRRRQTLP